MALVDLNGGSGGDFGPQVGTGAGGSGGGSNNGGGVPGTGTGSSSVPTGLPTGENGGVFATTYQLFVPVENCSSGQCYIGFFDVTSFDDQTDGSSYSYRQEDINPDAVATVDRVWVTYRDLGLARMTLTLTGTNDNGAIVSNSIVVTIGNITPTNALLSKQFGLTLSAFRPQLTVSRNAGDGPISIVRVRLLGETEAL